jgi:hypothetical protein
MAVFSPSGPGSVSVSGGIGTKISTPNLANEIAVAANTEYSYSFPAQTKYFRLKARDNSKLQLSYISGDSSILFLTLFPGFEYESPPFEVDSSITVYFQSNKAGTVVEIESWS